MFGFLFWADLFGRMTRSSLLSELKVLAMSALSKLMSHVNVSACSMPLWLIGCGHGITEISSLARVIRSLEIVLSRVEFRCVLGEWESRLEVPNNAVSGARLDSAFLSRRCSISMRLVTMSVCKDGR